MVKLSIHLTLANSFPFTTKMNPHKVNPMEKERGLILLDRDGVLNAMVIDPEHGTIDSPLHPSQVEVFPWVPKALLSLQEKGYGLAIATNQPAAAKGKTTRENLENAHKKVVSIAESAGARILSSHICFHRSEDGCSCRKPKTGLLEGALKRHPEFHKGLSWMVGDGVHDIRAGATLSLKTAFIGSHKWDMERVFTDASLRPTLWVENLKEFADLLLSGRETP